jgi:ABC-type nitrate/sulfonate/bicarbonate transport system substrate-binding protein
VTHRAFQKWLLPAILLVVSEIIGIVAVAAQSDFPIGYSSLGGTYAFIALIEEQRLLEQEGIRPQFIYIGGPQITQALIAGDIRMAIVGGASPVRAAAQGAELRFIGGVTDKENITIVTDAKITKPAELKGTRMAIDRLGDYSDFRARKVLERYGLEAQKDVILLQIGGQTGRFAALRSGQVQSTFVAPPLTLIAKKAGFRGTQRERSLRRHARDHSRVASLQKQPRVSDPQPIAISQGHRP